MKRRWIAAASAVAALLLVAPAAAQAAKTYSGAMTNGGGAVREGSQGAFWQSRFTEHRKGRVLYTACVIHLQREDTVLCKAARTGRRGVSRLFFAPFVNLHPGALGGPLLHPRQPGRRAALPRARRGKLRSGQDSYSPQPRPPLAAT